MNAYYVTVYNSDTKTCRIIEMHGYSANEVLARANMTIGPNDAVTDVN